MLDDRLTCSNCGTLFYYEEVRNIVKHRKKEMPIRCPNCNEVIKRKLSHGYFVSYELYEESKINLKKKPKYYKNLKTGAIITEKEFKNLVTEEESRFIICLVIFALDLWIRLLKMSQLNQLKTMFLLTYQNRKNNPVFTVNYFNFDFQ